MGDKALPIVCDVRSEEQVLEAVRKTVEAFGGIDNSLWPRTTIVPATINMLGGDALMRKSRVPEIVAGVAHVIFTRIPSRRWRIGR